MSNPSVERLYGVCTTLYKNESGLPHRLDGPAKEMRYECGKLISQSWYINGYKHREDGPAEEFGDDRKWWYCNGKLHNISGPAVIFNSDMVHDGLQWWINGINYTKENYDLQLINNKFNTMTLGKDKNDLLQSLTTNLKNIKLN